MRAISVKTMLWLLLLVVPACAAETGAWNCDGKFGLCRYLSSATKQEIIPPRFERAMPFSEGVAAVSIGGRVGYVDERGKVVIEPRFDLAGEFSNGLAEVLIGDKTGVINRKGEIVVQPKARGGPAIMRGSKDFPDFQRALLASAIPASTTPPDIGSESLI